MEAATVQTKKGINKGKLKKTIKNILCLPDTVFWPIIHDEHKQLVEKALDKLKVDMPHYVKIHWKELKLIPKEKRPKPPKAKKVEGLLFGISECYDAVKSLECAAVIIDGAINPRVIVQHVLDACIESKIPVICVSGLRKLSYKNFHIPTSCLGVKRNCLNEIQNVVTEIATNYKVPQKDKKPVKMEHTEIKSFEESVQRTDNEITVFPYLHRTDKKYRAFVPSEQTMKLTDSIEKFKGQDFIGFKGKNDYKIDSKSYMKMIVKRISNNPNRLQSVRKRTHDK